MRLIHTLTLAAALAATGARADCAAPDQPVLPDGATATLEQMVAGQQAVKTYQTANVEYMKCLEARFGAAEKVAKKSRDADDKAAAQATYAEAVQAYNNAVSDEERVAGEFNIQIREYKAASAN